MTQDALHDRGKAMEDIFFRSMDEKLLEKMKAELKSDEDRSALVSATGISDKNVIQQLIDQGVTTETLASIGLIPLVAVAWADGKMDNDERTAILKAASEAGIGEQHGSYQLINNWLRQQPGDELLASWQDYISAMKETLDAAAVSQIKNSVIDRAKKVANAAGGFLGIHKTSDVEQKVIDSLSSTFD